MGVTHIIALRQSPMGMTPSFSPSSGNLKREKASLISVSWAAVMPCSFASLDGRATFAAGGAAAGGLRLGGWMRGSISEWAWLAGNDMRGGGDGDVPCLRGGQFRVAGEVGA